MLTSKWLQYCTRKCRNNHKLVATILLVCPSTNYSTKAHCDSYGATYLHNSVLQQRSRQLCDCVNRPVQFPNRCFSTEHSLAQKVKAKKTTQIVESDETPFSKLSTTLKVARAGKDAAYTGIFVVGFGITGLMFYAIGRELFSGQSPSGIYGRALKLCRKNEELTCAIGTPVKGYGEMSSRGRRRHVRHTIYEKDGVKHMRIKFYVEGPDAKGTVHLEAKQNESGKYEFRYIFAEIEDGIYSRTFIIEDNR